MSCVLTLTSAAIIAGISISGTIAVGIASNICEDNYNEEEGFDTVFVDSEILLKTLNEYDCHVEVISNNEYIVKTTCGNLRYARKNESQPFKLYINEISNPDELIENIKSFEEDYGKNVQAYTYNHIKENLTESMSIVSEEILDDDSMVLTIKI